MNERTNKWMNEWSNKRTDKQILAFLELLSEPKTI